MAKNKRQPYAVSEKAGEQTSAESWGTGTFGQMRKAWNEEYLTKANKVVLSHVFLVSPVVVHTEPDKQRSVTSVDPVACSLPRRSGENGTRRSTWAKSTN